MHFLHFDDGGDDGDDGDVEDVEDDVSSSFPASVEIIQSNDCLFWFFLLVLLCVTRLQQTDRNRGGIKDLNWIGLPPASLLNKHCQSTKRKKI